MKLRLGTRGSQLALWQSEWVQTALSAHGVSVELVTLRTAGDDWRGSLTASDGQGLFTKRLQAALLDDEVDLAVHSLKDLPTETPEELELVAIPDRADSRDALIAQNGKTFAQLRPGARIGTGSVRRRAQMLHLRPDLKMVDVRGNLDTRLQQVTGEKLDAIVLARAGLLRLGWEHHISEIFSCQQMMPAVGQGALAVEMRREHPAFAAVAAIDDRVSRACVVAERGLLRCLEAGCLAPVGAHAEWIDNEVRLSAVVLDPAGTRRLEANQNDLPENAAALGEALGQRLLSQGAADLL